MPAPVLPMTVLLTALASSASGSPCSLLSSQDWLLSPASFLLPSIKISWNTTLAECSERGTGFFTITVGLKISQACLIKWATSGDPVVGSGSIIVKDCISTNIGMMEFIFPLVVTEHWAGHKQTLMWNEDISRISITLSPLYRLKCSPDNLDIPESYVQNCQKMIRIEILRGKSYL